MTVVMPQLSRLSGRSPVRDEFGTVPGKADTSDGIMWRLRFRLHTHTHTHIHRSALIELKFSAVQRARSKKSADKRGRGEVREGTIGEERGVFTKETKG